ncbi:unnamed protein product [Urochloa humidicola]
MGGKGSALALLLALVVAMSFFAGQSSARISSDFPSRIQGAAAGVEVERPDGEEACKDCSCSLTNGGGCTCYDTFTSCPSFCSGGNGCWCSDRFGCQCVKFIDNKWCGTEALKKKPISDALPSAE